MHIEKTGSPSNRQEKEAQETREKRTLKRKKEK